MWLLIGCSTGMEEDNMVVLPGHNDCLPEGEEMSEEICRAVVAADPRQPTVSENKAPEEAGPNDQRLQDPEFLWVTSEVNRCTCRCCHTKSWGGPGVYFWDLEFEPVWVDSASNWSLSVFAGKTGEVEQTLPTEDIERLEAWVDGELDRRR
jgi:hypothetical protein